MGERSVPEVGGGDQIPVAPTPTANSGCADVVRQNSPTVQTGENVPPLPEASVDKFPVICSRCKQSGDEVKNYHIMLLCDICESPDHIAPRCPLLKVPKP